MASPAQPPVLPPGAAHSRLSTLLMLVGLVAAGSPLPYTAVAVIPLVWAGVESGLAVRARSNAQAPTRAIVSGVIGLVLACALTVMVLLPFAFYDAQKRLQDCTLGANTAIAVSACKSQAGSLESFLGDFLNYG